MEPRTAGRRWSPDPEATQYHGRLNARFGCFEFGQNPNPRLLYTLNRQLREPEHLFTNADAAELCIRAPQQKRAQEDEKAA